MQTKNPTPYFNVKQGTLPTFISDFLPIDDEVLVFDHLMEGIDFKPYLKARKFHMPGRPRYNQADLLKTVLFGFMNGYTSLRKLADDCRVNVRFMYLMNSETPSYRTFGDFINSLSGSIEDIFNAINKKIFAEDHVDLDHVYIDGTKLEANANKYTWVWKKAAVKSRYRLFGRITSLLEEINADVACGGVRIETSTEYTPDYLERQIAALADYWHIDTGKFVHGRGHRKTTHQRLFEKLVSYTKKLEEYGTKISICGPKRNSYSKTDPSATFMRIKKDYMGNDRLLPSYNIQYGICDEYIAAVLVSQCRSDMDCFIPLMDKFYKTYGLYPGYPVADAGYGSFNNYIYCQQHNMGKYMKYPLFRKETTDKKYKDDPFRAVNFKIDESGTLRCPNNRAFHFQYRQPVRGNQYGRQEEVYRCDDCTGCPYAEKCKRGKGNRTIRLNEELTSIHEEVIRNLESTPGYLLRMNRSIQSEGTYGIVKNDHGYDRIRRRGMKKVELEIYLISIGQNLNKYYQKRKRLRKAA